MTILAGLLPRRLLRASRIVLWGRRLDAHLEPPDLPPGLAVARVTGRDLGSPRLARLVEAMHPTPLLEIHDRLSSGRRAYAVEAGPSVVAYGWVSLGDEHIAEVEGTIRVGPGEAYIWDCATLPAWRGRGLYPALLRAIARDLAAEGLEWVWIAARRENLPSLRGFEKAGYVPMANVDYWRLWRWRRLAVRPDAGAAAARGRPLCRVVA